MPQPNPAQPSPDTPDVMGDVIRTVRVMLARNYGRAQWAVVVIHLDDDTPDLSIPVIPARISPSAASSSR